eukprot:TRINITY_DN2129_c0_g1_i1.p1 TRINITY_DN2129_c0_g1~~TRINITY_DN2129_c0_g1_i1.p1  ORF type:complete len:687 (+),score=272.45 TRINITY_DN2129_c0_g1_i1:165-2225(+)
MWRESMGLLSLIVFVRQDLVNTISNISSSSVHVGDLEINKTNAIDGPSTTSSSSSSSTSPIVTKGEFEETPGEPGTEEGEEDDDQDEVLDEMKEGCVAVSMNIGLTTLCLVNFHLEVDDSEDSMLELIEEIEERLADLSSLSEFDIGSEFNHTFWMGRCQSAQVGEFEADHWDIHCAHMDSEQQEIVLDDGTEFIQQWENDNPLGIILSQNNGLFGYKEAAVRIAKDRTTDVQLWTDIVFSRHHANNLGTIVESQANMQSFSGQNPPITSSYDLEVTLSPIQLMESNDVVTHIELTEMSASGLNKADLNGLADPYLVLYSPFCEEPYHTQVINNSLNPSWEELASLNSFVTGEADLATVLSRQEILVSVWDHDKLRSNSVIGLGSIALLDTIVDEPVPFQSELSLNGSAAGLISGKVRIVMESAEEWKTRVGKMSVSKKGGVMVWKKRPPVNKKVYVTVHEATSLAVKDSNGFSDPFCQLIVEKQKQKSTCKEKNLDPVWEESFEFDVTQLHGKIVCNLWDKDRLVNDYMGTVTIPIMELRDQMPHDEWYTIETDQKHSKHEVSGKIRIETRLKDVESLVCMLCSRSMDSKRAAVVPLYTLLDLTQPFFRDLTVEDFDLIEKHGVRKLYGLLENQAFSDLHSMIEGILANFETASEKTNGADAFDTKRFSMRKKKRGSRAALVVEK